MNKYIINRGFGEYSSGTEVYILDEGSSPEEGSYYTVQPVNAELDSAFDIPQELITRKRNRTDDIPNPTRKVRRIGKPRKQTVQPPTS